MSEQLGHASVQITLDRYSHLMPQSYDHAGERLAAALFGRMQLVAGQPEGEQPAAATSVPRSLRGWGAVNCKRFASSQPRHARYAVEAEAAPTAEDNAPMRVARHDAEPADPPQRLDELGVTGSTPVPPILTQVH